MCSGALSEPVEAARRDGSAPMLSDTAAKSEMANVDKRADRDHS